MIQFSVYLFFYCLDVRKFFVFKISSNSINMNQLSAIMLQFVFLIGFIKFETVQQLFSFCH